MTSENQVGKVIDDKQVECTHTDEDSHGYAEIRGKSFSF